VLQKKSEFIGYIYGSGIKDPIVGSLSIRPHEFNKFLKTL